MTHLHGRAAVLTGAGSGFGLECARLAADAGMHVVLVDVQADALAAAEGEIGARAAPHGGRVLAQRVDVADAAQMDALASRVLADFGAPALVFNNAGVGGAGGLCWEASAQDWQWVFGVNLLGVAHGVRVFTPAMLAAARADPHYRGHLVNTASMAGLLAAPNMAVYNASKHAVVGLTETLYHDLSLVTDRVHAHLLCPYFVATGIARSERNRPDALRNAAPATASQRIGKVMVEQALQHGKVSAAQVAQQVFDALHTQRFFIFSHPHLVAPVAARYADAAQGRQPADPFAHKPALREELRRALGAA